MSLINFKIASISDNSPQVIGWFLIIHLFVIIRPKLFPKSSQKSKPVKNHRHMQVTSKILSDRELSSSFVPTEVL